MTKQTFTSIVDVLGAGLATSCTTFLVFLGLVAALQVDMDGIGPWICLTIAGAAGGLVGRLVLAIFKTPAFARKQVAQGVTK